MKNVRKHSTALIALTAALSMPLAFAQEQATSAAEPQEATPTPQTTPEASASQALTWADLDTDGNGTLSRQEATSVQSLAQVFDEADADGDGQLTPEEYRQYVARADATTPPTDGGND
jgi:hypothetical protein